jgi:cell division protein FtsL
MLGASTAVAIAVTLGCAFALYAINYDTRRLEQRVQAQERAVEKAASKITVLKAERAYLARPDRIEPVARALGMQPLTEKQYVTLQDFPLLHHRPNDGSRPPPATHGSDRNSSR